MSIPFVISHERNNVNHLQTKLLTSSIVPLRKCHRVVSPNHAPFKKETSLIRFIRSLIPTIILMEKDTFFLFLLGGTGIEIHMAVVHI